MMKIPAKLLIEDLKKRTHAVSQQVSEYLTLDPSILNAKQTPVQWSALECIEHLNRYSAFYLPEIRNCLTNGKAIGNDVSTFKSGVLGNYFANSVADKPKLNKMKTFKVMNPAGSQLDRDVINTFLADQEILVKLLNEAEKIDLTRTKTAISISKLIKLRMGDTLRVVIYHNERHLAQANRAISAASN